MSIQCFCNPIKLYYCHFSFTVHKRVNSAKFIGTKRPIMLQMFTATTWSIKRTQRISWSQARKLKSVSWVYQCQVEPLRQKRVHQEQKNQWQSILSFLDLEAMLWQKTSGSELMSHYCSQDSSFWYALNKRSRFHNLNCHFSYHLLQCHYLSVSHSVVT